MAAPLDMNLPDSFHRLKRTVLLFSAALIVLGLSEPALDRELHAGLVDIRLGTAWAQWLLWLAGLYYLLGFALEVATARRMNSELMLGAAAMDFDRTCVALAGEVRAKVPAILAGADNIVSRGAVLSNHLAEQLEPATMRWSDADLLRAAFAGRHNIAPLTDVSDEAVAQTLRTAIESNLTSTFDQRAHDFSQRIEAGLVDVRMYNERAADLPGQMADLAEKLEKVSGGLQRMHPGIVASRRLSFWAWEIGGASFAFVVATAIGWPPARWLWSFVGARGSLDQFGFACSIT